MIWAVASSSFCRKVWVAERKRFFFFFFAHVWDEGERGGDTFGTCLSRFYFGTGDVDKSKIRENSCRLSSIFF